jgi:probable rRNA maturation factor
MSVVVTTRRATPTLSSAGVRRDVRTLLQALGEERAEVTVTFVDDAEIRVLNRDYRAMDRSTDVLAFAMREGLRVDGDASELGDVVISLETAARQARSHRVPLASEVRSLLIHGLLHLLGYDHERSAAAARRMRAMARQLRALLAAAPPAASRRRRPRRAGATATP